MADGGTVFLDEVGDLPLDAQVMLLRFLQSGEIRPVGSLGARRVNVRLISATHRNLETAVEHGTFREDLYYRLRRMVLEVLTLRARREDFELLVEHFLAQINVRYGFGVRGATPAALRILEHIRGGVTCASLRPSWSRRSSSARAIGSPPWTLIYHCTVAASQRARLSGPREHRCRT